MTGEEAASRAALLERAAAAFVARFGGQPAWQWFVPGRIEVMGKHTDYAGGRSLLAAVPRGFAVVARRRADSVVRVVDAGDGGLHELDAARGGASPRGWAHYVEVVARRLARNFPGASLGAEIAILSDLPRAAGLSSSSALVVGVATALVRCAELTRRDDWRGAIGTVEDLAWYLGCVENGSDFRGFDGTSGVGTHGGSEDHTAILACRAGAAQSVPLRPGHAHRRYPDARRLDVHRGNERGAREQDRPGQGPVQPRSARRAGTPRRLERRDRYAGALARGGARLARGRLAAARAVGAHDRQRLHRR